MNNNTNANFNALSWAGGSCPTGSSYTGNLLLTMGNNTNLTVSANYTITGDFNITNTGSSSSLIVPAGVTFHVTGNLGDCTNNNVNFVVNGTLIVDGTISGRNNVAFSGSGSITAGGLYFNNNITCPSCSIVWTVGACTGPAAFCTLPIRLALFQGEVKANGVHLRWITESESGVDRITLEKSSNGKDFHSLAEFPSQGDTQQRRTYGFLDEHPLIGKSYYRLKESDLDGYIKYHRIISIEYSGGRLLDLYPVPVTGGVLNLRTNFRNGFDSRVIISDLTGLALQETVLRGGDELRVPVKLEPGIYVLTFISGDYRTVKRFVVH